MTAHICGVCGRTDHDEVAHYTASGAMKAARTAERNGERGVAELFYQLATKLARDAARLQSGPLRAASRNR